MSYRCLAFVAFFITFADGFNLLKFKHPTSRKFKTHCHGEKLPFVAKEVDVVVTGSGITGSTAAFYLHKYGKDVILTERGNDVGGNLVSKSEDGYLWEEGPNSFQPNIAILRLAKDLNMLDELVLADPSLPRFIYWNKDLHALPSSIHDILNFNLLSCAGKIRAAIGLLGLIQPAPQEEESVKQFITRHLGSETFEKIIDPFISGVYAGDPAKLSMKSALKKIKILEDLGCSRGILDGAMIRMNEVLKEKRTEKLNNGDLPKIAPGSLGSFKRGLQSLPIQIRSVLGEKVKMNHKLVKIHRDGNYFLTEFHTSEGIKHYKSKYLLLTTPASTVAEIMENSDIPLSSDILQNLRKIYYPPVASVSLSYPTDAFKRELKGFGNLIPRSENIRTLGTIWSSSLFKDRAPPGRSLLLSFIGGSRDPHAVEMNKEAIVEQVHNDIAKILLLDSTVKPKVLGVRIWSKAIPQYEIGHQEILKSVEAIEEAVPGLYLTGNYRSGVAFGDCITSGKATAMDITKNI